MKVTEFELKELAFSDPKFAEYIIEMVVNGGLRYGQKGSDKVLLKIMQHYYNVEIINE